MSNHLTPSSPTPHCTGFEAHVTACLSKVLKPRGKLVVEFGGSGNIRRLTQAIHKAYADLLGRTRNHPWYFPSIPEFTAILAAHGLETIQATITDRPTELIGDYGLRDWVRMFGSHWLDDLNPEQEK